jgi:2-polyprenyl-3-methyl-5-hydroxy-6-metoxy-1,4-benzoquinol methylase
MSASTALDTDVVAALQRRRRELGASFPRCVAVFFGDAERAQALCSALERVPLAVAPLFGEIAVLWSADPPSAALRSKLDALAARIPNLRVHADPRRYGFGGRRKIAFEYALQHAFEFVAVLEPDASSPPEHLADLLGAALLDGRQVVLASDARGSRSCAALHNAVLALNLSDYATPFRMYSCEVLRRVPFHLNGDERGFDTELLIQCRALGVDPFEIELPAAPGGGVARSGFRCASSLGLALGYRAHQLHLTRRGQYFVDHDVRYTLKHSPSSSHMQVLAAIAPGSVVLDLGCSQGLLAAPLRKKNVRVVGVDSGEPALVSPELDAYYQRDLEAPLELPETRVFDYVVVSDVIEHVVNRVELLRSVRRYLKPEGRLLISTPNVALWFYRLSLAAGRFEYGPRGILDETHVHLFTRATFRREVEHAAFRILSERVTSLPFEIVFESTGRSRAVRALAASYHFLARLWPEMFAYQFLLEAEVATLLDPAPANRRQP